MKKTDFNSKFMIDEGKTFAEWKEWVRKFKPTQAKAHVVQATLKNGKKFDRVYGSYVDAQNNAFALKQQFGAKNVKMFTSVNGGPLKLERSFDSAEDSSMIEGIAKKYAIDAVFPTSKGFANEKGLLKRDTRKGLKPYEVTFVVKGKDGRPFNTKRSKMAASIEEAKRWAQSESKKYNGVTKIDVKEFKDEADSIKMINAKYQSDAGMTESQQKAKAAIDDCSKISTLLSKISYNGDPEVQNAVKAVQAPFKNLLVVLKKKVLTR